MAQSAFQRWIISGALGHWEWFGHSGGLLGYISRTCLIPSHGLAISVLTIALDGLAHSWLDGTMHILRTFQTRATPPQRLRNWTERWRSAWGAGDLIPLGEPVVFANPHLFNPFQDAPEIAVTRGGAALAGIATSVGFLGAGVILHQRAHVRGPSTAATFWAVAAVGRRGVGGIPAGSLLDRHGVHCTCPYAAVIGLDRTGRATGGYRAALSRA